MKYTCFEELPVWQDAIELAVQIFDLTSRPEFKGYYSLKDQLERAGVSVSNNIAEGFERGSTQDPDLSIYFEGLIRRSSFVDLSSGTLTVLPFSFEPCTQHQSAFDEDLASAKWLV